MMLECCVGSEKDYFDEQDSRPVSTDSATDDNALHASSAAATELKSHANISQRSALTGRLKTLSPGEKELLDLLVAGHSNKQVALQLQISIKTVENHRSKLMKKMGATNAAELVRMRMQAA